MSRPRRRPDPYALALGARRSLTLRALALAAAFALATAGIFALQRVVPSLFSEQLAVGVALVAEGVAVLAATAQAFHNDGWVGTVPLALAPVAGAVVAEVLFTRVALGAFVLGALAVSALGSGARRLSRTA